jgi:MFS-type transporter involved in bile tolerance (Atg22 family)
MPKNSDQNWGRYLGVGIQMGVGAALGAVIGSWLDRRYGWNGMGVLVGSMLGIAAGMYLLIKEALRINKD